MADPNLQEVTFKGFEGLNNGMGNESVGPTEAIDLENIRFDARGNIIKGYGMTDMNLTTWPTGVKVFGMKFNALYQKYYYIIQVTDYATFYEYVSGTWTLRGHTTENDATTGAGDLTLVTDSNAPTSAAFQKNVQVGDYFKYDEDADTAWTKISAVPSDTTLTLAVAYPEGAKAAKKYTVRKHLGLYNYLVLENPTLEDYSYWTCSNENTSYIYKWDETAGTIDVSAPTNQPANPKQCLSFKNRLWSTKGTVAWDISTNTDAIWKFNETASATLPVDSIGSNDATDVDTTVAFANGLLNYCRSALPTDYGDGTDGAITITAGSVKIEDIYEDENVAGVTTALGAGKGLNKGAGTYDPENGAYPNCTNFTIDATCTLTHGTVYGAGASNKNGIIWVTCTGTFTNNGTIDMDGLGHEGRWYQNRGDNRGYDGYGPGAGFGGLKPWSEGGVGGTGGSSYGSSSIPTTTWEDLYGSSGGQGSGSHYVMPLSYAGGGGGGAGHSASGTTGNTRALGGSGFGDGGDGGDGGGAIRIYASIFITSSGTITADGANGVAAPGGGGGGTNGGGGAGGSGGSIYIETFDGTLGINLITSSAGNGAAGHDKGGTGGAGTTGRIHIQGSYTGSTDDPAIA